MNHRPRISETSLQTPGPLTVSILGPPKLTSNRKNIAIVGRGKSDCLLVSLALFHRNVIARHHLLEQIWPEQSTDLAGQSLNSVTSELNKLGRKHFAFDNLILHEQGYYRFNSEAGVGTDIEYFDAWACMGQALLTQGEIENGLRYCEQAMALYRGDLCGDTSIHAVIERERLRTVLLDLLTILANHHYALGAPAQALPFLQRLLGREPCREDAHRQIMRCYMHLGQRAQALRAYQLCVHALAVEFDITPEPETVALYEQIRLNPTNL